MWGAPWVSPPAPASVAASLLRHFGLYGGHGSTARIRNSRQLPQRHPVPTAPEPRPSGTPRAVRCLQPPPPAVLQPAGRRRPTSGAGRRLSAANMVRMTTAQNATAPTPGSMVTIAPKRTSAPEQRFHEDVDHRPAADPAHDVVQPGAVAQPDGAPGSGWRSASPSSPTSFSIGTAMLAKNTSAASGYMCDASSSSTPPRMVLGAPAPSCITVSTGIVVGRDVEHRGGDHQRPGAAMLSGLRACSAERAARQQMRHALGQPASLTRPHASQPIACEAVTTGAPASASRVGGELALDRLPYRLPVERRVGPDHHDGERQQRVDAGAERDVHQVAELHVGDEHAEARTPRSSTTAAAARPRRTPRAGGRRPPHRAGRPARRAVASSLPNGASRVVKTTASASGDMPRRTSSVGARQQVGAVRDAGGRDRHQRRRAHHVSSTSAADRQRQAAAERIGARAAQRGAAAEQRAADAGRERRHGLEQRRSPGIPAARPASGHSVTPAAVARRLTLRRSIAASPSASWPTRVLIAATSARTRRRRLAAPTMRKLRAIGAAPRRSNIDRRLGEQHEWPAASASSRWMLSSTVASGRDRDGAALGVDRAARQALAQLLHQHPAQHRPAAARPTSRWPCTSSR